RCASVPGPFSLLLCMGRIVTPLRLPRPARLPQYGYSTGTGLKWANYPEGICMSTQPETEIETSAGTGISPVTEIVAELRAGRMVILVDEEDRENEGDLVLAAEFVTPEDINFMVTHARGLVCLTLTEERCRQLDLPLMASRNGTRYGTNFTMSIEAAEGVETGIS